MSDSLRIAFYAPLKPLGHPHPSGDLVIGTGLYQFLQRRGHRLESISQFRTRWVYWKPWRWLQFLRARSRSLQRCSKLDANLWLTYHSYYKAPDLLGPDCSRRLRLPYVVFQGIYSTKRRKRWQTWAGFVLNRRALLAADHVFTNRKEDFVNLGRLVREESLTYVVPGILPEQFGFDAEFRKQLRQQWDITEGVVVLTAAMFRPGVKSEGLSWVIRSCGELFRQNVPLYLVIAGEGKEESRLRQLADSHLPGRVRFLGKVEREKMYRFYSAGDLFVFPGIRESLGMVFLEAQSCGLPVVAFADGGVPEVVADGICGYLVHPFHASEFNEAIGRLLADQDLRKKMGEAARGYIRNRHDLKSNYRVVEEILLELVARKSTQSIEGRRQQADERGEKRTRN
ncbi:MAG: glycosyltransferase family 4 protein [Syntrophobacterales bacterium]|jgi:glycosyltransferase involved in cell wall biosynthesis